MGTVLSMCEIAGNSGMTWPILGAAAVILCEALYRMFPRLPWTWWLPVTVPLMLVINYAVYRIMVGAESLIGGVVAFSIAVAVLRAVVSLGIGETPRWQDWVAMGLVLAALVTRVGV